MRKKQTVLPTITYPDIPKHDALGVAIHERVRQLLSRKAQSAGQRTEIWVAERMELMTASSAASVLRLSQLEIDLRDAGIIDLESDKKLGHVMPAFNTYAKEMRIKCGVESSGGGNVFTEWGVTYEPIVKELYERFYNVTVHEFGLVKHDVHEWLGASPDGITSEGRMIEIKCPYSRQPKGMPKCQYYVQMQIQMECCGFEECDFLDIVIREYASKEDYLSDTYGVEGTEEFVYHRNGKGMPKGLVVEWEHTDEDGRVHREYFYPPVLTFKTRAEEEAWIISWCEKHTQDNPMTLQRTLNLIYNGTDVYRFRYWWIDEWNNTTVQKNEAWLKQRLPDIHEFWKLVLKYRKEGLPDKLLLKSRTTTEPDQNQLYLTQSGKLTNETTNTECLFWDDGEDNIDQPIITNIQDTKKHVTPFGKKMKVAAEPILSSESCLFDDDDENYE